MSVVRIICGVLSLVFCIFYITIGSYWTYQMFLARQNLVLHKRRVNLSLLNNMLLLFNSFLYFMLMISYTFEILRSFHWIYYSGVFVHYCAFYVCIWRFILLSFDINWTVSMINMEWHKLLNPTILTHDFFIRHKKTLGNSRFVRNVLIVIVLTTFSLVMIPALYKEHNKELWSGIPQRQQEKWDLALAFGYIFLFTIPAVGLIVIMYKTPIFHDAFLVRQEMKLFTIIVVVDLTVYLLVSILHYALGFDPERKTDGEFFLDVFLYNCLAISNFAAVLVTSYWVLVRIQPLLNNQSVESLIKVKEFHKIQEQKAEELTIEMSNNPSGDKSGPIPLKTTISMEMAHGSGHIGDIPLSPRLESTKSSESNHNLLGPSIKIPLLSKIDLAGDVGRSQNNHKNITLKMVLGHIKAFEAFMAYLAKEFSMEMGLSLCEFIQFEKYAVSKLLHSKYILSEEIIESAQQQYLQLYRLIPLTDDIPKSYIIYGDNADEIHEVSYSQTFSERNLVSKIKNRLAVTAISRDPSTIEKVRLSSLEPPDLRISTGSESPTNRETTIVVEVNIEEIIEDLRDKARLLYDKYVASDAPYVINVSYDQRIETADQIISNLPVDPKLWEREAVLKFISVFDACGVEVFRLLINAFRRWQRTDQFIQLCDMVFLSSPVES